MTAVGGDLGFMGDLAALVMAKTMSERVGDIRHRLPGDHLLVGLGATAGVLAPFNFNNAGNFRWRQSGRPTDDCPSCGTLRVAA